MSSITNLGNEKLNINTTTAKGLEKLIGIIGRFVINAQSSVNKTLYGSFKLQNDPLANKIQKALDKGISNTLSDLVGINYCDIINYLSNEIPGGEKFNPENPPNNAGSFGRTKWFVQKQAFEIQKKIDGYYGSYGGSNNSLSKIGLYNLTKEISDIFSTLLNSESGLNDPEIKKQFPQVSIITNGLQDIIQNFTSYQSPNSITQADIQKLLRSVEKVKAYCIAIIGLNSPAAFLNLANAATGGAIQNQIASLTKIVDIPRFLPLIKQLINAANNINSIGRKLLGYINTGRTIITICLGLIKIYNIVKIFITAIAIPSLFGTKGSDIKLNDIYQEKLKEQGEKKFIKRLNQINAVLNLMAICVSTILAGITDITYKLNLIKLNLESCNPEIADDIDNTISNLNKTGSQLKDFLDKYNSAGQKINKQFGAYTIDIITEELADEGISLRRRYGIARDNNGYLVVQTTPTFASLDLIIINEVKVLLVSKGLVTFDLGSISSENSLTVLESLRFLGNEELSLDNIEVTSVDLGVLKENTDAIGLTNFIDNLNGGKALRKKVRKLMSAQASGLKDNLSKADPLGKFSGGISNGYAEEVNTKEIDKLKQQRSDLQQKLALSNSPGEKVGYSIKIKSIENQIADLENQ